MRCLGFLAMQEGTFHDYGPWRKEVKIPDATMQTSRTAFDIYLNDAPEETWEVYFFMLGNELRWGR